MNWRSLKSSIPAFSPVGLGALVAVLGMTFLTTVLIPESNSQASSWRARRP